MDRDPVCKRKMNRNKAYVTIQYKGENYYLCCPLCQAEFEKDPEKYIANVSKKGSKVQNDKMCAS
jgi:YHS domain-containing protein